jgi:hypothetical protein
LISFPSDFRLILTGQHGNDQTQNDVQLNNTDNIVNNNDEDGVFEIEKILRKTYINANGCT